MQQMVIPHLNSLHDYKVILTYFRFVSVFVKKPFYSHRQSKVCYQCPVMLRSAGQLSNPDSVITDI